MFTPKPSIFFRLFLRSEHDATGCVVYDIVLYLQLSIYRLHEPAKPNAFRIRQHVISSTIHSNVFFCPLSTMLLRIRHRNSNYLFFSVRHTKTLHETIQITRIRIIRRNYAQITRISRYDGFSGRHGPRLAHNIQSSFNGDSMQSRMNTRVLRSSRVIDSENIVTGPNNNNINGQTRPALAEE